MKLFCIPALLGIAGHAALGVGAAPVIITQPASQAVFEGAAAVFSVGATNSPPFTYQWLLDNGRFLTNLTDRSNISGSQSNTLTIAAVAATNVGAYSVIVSNSAGAATSASAFLTIVPWRPVITGSPTNTTVLPGAPATFGVAAVGTRPYSYRWQRNGAALNDDLTISGSATSMLTVRSVTQATLGTYLVLVSNSLGTATSTGALLDAVPVTAPGVTLSTLSSFTGAGIGPRYPYGRLALAADGQLYGTSTHGGGQQDVGAIFRVSTNGTMIPMLALGYSNGVPYAGFLPAADGSLLGCSSTGGTNFAGCIFRFTTNGTISTIASLNVQNGSSPRAELVPGLDGSVYGTASSGGGLTEGTVFKVATNGVVTPLYSFNGPEGDKPYGALVPDDEGNWYGTTTTGVGPTQGGTVFSISRSGTFGTLAVFQGTNGLYPYAGLVRDLDGTLYGTTHDGGANSNGTVFKITPEGALVSMHSFLGGNEGSNPYGGLNLGVDGCWYGTTESGGPYGSGTVFRLDRDGNVTTIAQFDGFQGANPESPPVPGADGNLYGTTQKGGGSNLGTVYRITIGGALQITGQPASLEVFAGDSASFQVATFGSLPVSYQWLRNGMVMTNSANASGATNRVLNLANADFADVGVYSVIVSNAFGAVTSAPAFLQVVASVPMITTQPLSQTSSVGSTVVFTVEAAGDGPLLYQWLKDGTNLTDGSHVAGSATDTLILNGLTTADEGAYSVLVSDDLFWEYSSEARLTVTPGYPWSTVATFSGGADGGSPNGLMQAADGNLYGTTVRGGAGGGIGFGVVYKVSTGGVMSVVTQLPLSSGGGSGSLVQGGDGNLYGTTWYGDPSGYGGVFRLTPDGTITNVHVFSFVEGSGPLTLIQGGDGNLYGMTSYGGAFYSGTIFKMSPDGTLSNLYVFKNGSDGFYPQSALLQGLDGAFYGCASQGGSNHFGGTAFRIVTDGTFSVLHNFGQPGEGLNLVAGLFQTPDGNFYGTTLSGGSGASAHGTVFRMTPDGTVTTLYQFADANGGAPMATLIQGFDGDLYGTTSAGGPGGYGTVFKVTTNGVLTTLAAFNYLNGAKPQTPLVQAADGTLYGTTSQGGPNNLGTVFKITPPASTAPPRFVAQPSDRTVYAGDTTVFSARAIGPAPLSYQWTGHGTNLEDGGNIFGSTTATLTISNVLPSDAGAYAVLAANAFGSNASSTANLTVLSSAPALTLLPTNQTLLPGMSARFSAAAVGSLPITFQWQLGGTNLTDDERVSGSASGVLTVHNVFSGDAGAYSVVVSNTLGIVVAGATLSVTAVSTTGIDLRSLGSFGAGGAGANPNGLALGPDGRLYGTTQIGGSNSAGTIFVVDDSGRPVDLYSFHGTADGAYPYAELIAGPDGTLYGTTSQGGSYGQGTAFRTGTNGLVTALYSFSTGAAGGVPYAPLAIDSNGLLYGTASSFGTFGSGVVFRMTTNGAFGVIHEFSGNQDGAFPVAGLVVASDGSFYGTAATGGDYDNGTVFKGTTNGTFTTLYGFAGGSDGSFPAATLLQGADGNLYGTAVGGGDFDNGVVFRVATNGSFSVLYSFTGGLDGASPQAGLCVGPDGGYYGTTAYGGIYNDGTVFRMTTDGVISTVAWFDGFNGETPRSRLVSGSDSALYGTTENGGANGLGTVFRIALSTTAPPAFRSIAQSAGSWTLAWDAIPGRKYRIQWTPDLVAGTWTDAGVVIAATESIAVATNTPVNGSQMFYRLQLLP